MIQATPPFIPIPDGWQKVSPNPWLICSPPSLDRTPREGTLSLSSIDPALEDYFTIQPGTKRFADPIRCLLLLWHDHWEEAHEIAQALKSQDGSLLHAIIHRREPDYWNCKYWLRAAGNHPAYLELATMLKDGSQDASSSWIRGGKFDCVAFTESVELALQNSTPFILSQLQSIQALETCAVLTGWEV